MFYFTNLIFLINEGYNLVITHGNGPHVGNILMRNDTIIRDLTTD